MKNINAIFFDLGNVIIRFDLGILEKGYASYGYIPDGKLENYVNESENGLRYMQGKITSSQFYNRTRRYLKIDISFSDFYRVWNSMFYPYPEMEEIARKIKKKYPHLPLVLVSNTNKAHYNFLKEQYDILEIMDYHVLSHEVGRLKPHPDMYKEAIRLTGAIAKDIFYVDDRSDLIKAARAMGLRAFQFTGHEELRNQLSKFGILA